MPLHDKAFWVIIFSLGGILLASFINKWQDRFIIVVLAAALLSAAFLLFRRIPGLTPNKFEGLSRFNWFAFFSLFIVLGAGYYFIFDAIERNINIPFNRNAIFSGLITKVSTGLDKQKLVLELNHPYKGNIQITANRYPSWNYGDVARVEGNIKRPSERSAKYFEKENIFGLSDFPKMEIMEKNQGSPIASALFKIKSFAENLFNKVLPKEKASFMSGLILGETAEFNKEFKEKMSLTGTSHLVALSGYNITIIAKAIVLSLGLWFSRRKTFWISILAIFAFVIMTGAEASVVRAAIMAVLILLAGQLERAYSFRNSIAIAAFAMILFNPKILVFDIGFQLSFAAVMGLMYLKPAVHGVFRIKEEPGFLAWRENLTTTVSAQAAVLPIILTNFGLFSPISLITNVLILTFIPITMFLGAMIVLSGILSNILALAFAWLSNLFLSYEIGVIDLFSRINFQISLESFSIVLSFIYYLALIWLIGYSKRKTAGFTP